MPTCAGASTLQKKQTKNRPKILRTRKSHDNENSTKFSAPPKAKKCRTTAQARACVSLPQPTLAVRLIVDSVSIPPGRVRPANDDTNPAGSSTCSITSRDATRSNCSPVRLVRWRETDFIVLLTNTSEYRYCSAKRRNFRGEPQQQAALLLLQNKNTFVHAKLHHIY